MRLRAVRQGGVGGRVGVDDRPQRPRAVRLHRPHFRRRRDQERVVRLREKYVRAAEAELKVRADSDWTNSWGDGENNFKVDADGTYVVTITFDAAGNGTVTVAAK